MKFENEIKILNKIAEGINRTLDICDLFLSSDDLLSLNKIILILKQEE